jgi:hypothetical protein
MKSGWEIVPLEQLCSIKSGKSDTQDAVEDGAYAFFDRSRTIKKSPRYLYDCEAFISGHMLSLIFQIALTLSSFIISCITYVITFRMSQ